MKVVLNYTKDCNCTGEGLQRILLSLFGMGLSLDLTANEDDSYLLGKPKTFVPELTLDASLRLFGFGTELMLSYSTYWTGIEISIYGLGRRLRVSWQIVDLDDEAVEQKDH